MNAHENSDVFPFGSVAVDVMNSPGVVQTPLRTSLKLTVPAAFVFYTIVAR